MAAAIESAKRAAASLAVSENFPTSPTNPPKFIGIGSGSTIVYVVEAIRALSQDLSNVSFVPTGYQSRQLIIDGGLRPAQYDALPEGVGLDVCFDGADEVDEGLNCIKGGGACLFQEKLVAMRSMRFVCVADHRKLQPRLLSSWPSIPIEVAPIAARQVLSRLVELGSVNPKLREGTEAKSGPLKTDQDFFIIDAPFPKPLLLETEKEKSIVAEGKDFPDQWTVDALATAIKNIEGVLEVGIFYGRTGPEAASHGTVGGQRPVKAYFGMADGSVQVREAKQAI